MHGLSDWQLWVLTHPAELAIGVVGTVVGAIVAVLVWRQHVGKKKG